MAEATADNRRQLVNFAFFKVDPGWRRLPQASASRQARVLPGGGTIASRWPSPVLAGDLRRLDFLLWRIAISSSCFEMTAKLLATGLGRWLTVPTRSSMTKHPLSHGTSTTRSSTPAGASSRRVSIFHLSLREDARVVSDDGVGAQGTMKEHIAIGHKHLRVANTTYSFGLETRSLWWRSSRTSPKTLSIW
jgi:chlorite dismutase